jgi:hypothetical protein
MKKSTSLKTVIGMAALALLASLSPAKADTLEAAMKETGWDKIAGTWVDPDGNTTTFSWKYPGTVLQSVTKMGDTERYSMLWRNLKTGTVSIVSADNKGGSSKGDCEFSTGKAVFKIEFVSADGKSGNYAVHYALEGDNLSVNIEGQDKVIKLTRQ